MLQILFAFVWPTAIAVAVALLVGRVVATAVTLTSEAVDGGPAGAGERQSQRGLSAILSAMIASASSQALVVVSATTLGPVASAQIAVGQRIAGAPASLVGQAFTQVMLGAASPLIRYGETGLERLLRRQTVRVAILSAGAAVVLMTLGPLLAVPVLGEDYRAAGDLTAIFAVPLSLTLVALPATSLMIPLGRERQLFAIQLCRLGAIVTAILISSIIWSDTVVVSIVTSAVWTAAYVPLLYAAFVAARTHDRRALENG
ncbi:hypothetical protein AB3M83_12755 [Microbacterium sp. 179-B 1A2 NHS]|uniref:hypothetical protein n=1 Tax=Microbacterium sp. 179-B 1A2 NHS TaxID=3142383 RepID=UPI0039A32A7F